MENGSLILLVSFVSSLLIALIIYWIGGKMFAKPKRISKEKGISYACGENPPEVREVRINLERFFLFTVYFLIFDVFAFMIAISRFASWIYPVVYSIIVLLAVSVLLIARRRL